MTRVSKLSRLPPSRQDGFILSLTLGQESLEYLWKMAQFSVFSGILLVVVQVSFHGVFFRADCGADISVVSRTRNLPQHVRYDIHGLVSMFMHFH